MLAAGDSPPRPHGGVNSAGCARPPASRTNASMSPSSSPRTPIRATAPATACSPAPAGGDRRSDGHVEERFPPVWFQAPFLSSSQSSSAPIPLHANACAGPRHGPGRGSGLPSTTSPAPACRARQEQPRTSPAPACRARQEQPRERAGQVAVRAERQPAALRAPPESRPSPSDSSRTWRGQRRAREGARLRRA